MRVAYRYNKHADGEVVVSYTSPDADTTLVVAGQVTQINEDTRKVDMSERYPEDGYPSYEVSIAVSEEEAVKGEVNPESQLEAE